MGLSSTTNRVSYTGDGSSTIFSFPYYFFSPSDLQVYLFDINSSIVQAQLLNTHYTISGNVNNQGVYPSGGNVVMNSSFPASQQIVIARSPAQVQNYVLNQNGQINSLALVQQFDYMTTLIQRLEDQVGRCVQLPDGLGIRQNVAFSSVLPSNILLNSSAYAPLIVNSGATGWTIGTVMGTGSSAASYFGILPVPNGGTGQAGPLTQNGLIYAVNSSTMGNIAPGGQGQFLVSNGSSAPTFQTFAANLISSGVINVSNGGTGRVDLGNNAILLGQGSSAPVSWVIGSTGTFMQSQGPGNSPIFTPVPLNATSVSGVLPIALGGTNNGSSVISGSRLMSSDSAATIVQESAFAINGSNAITVFQGSLQNPGINFNGNTNTGIFMVSSSASAQSYVSVVASSIDTINVLAISGSSANVGIGVPASNATGSPLQVNRTLNGTVTHSFQNLSNAALSGTILQVANGPSSNYTTIENWANLAGTSYVAGGSMLFASPNQTKLIVGAEFVNSWIGFTVQGRQAQHERVRINSTNLTLNAAVRMIWSGSTGSVGIQAASSVTSYTMVLPTAQASGFIQNDGNGNLSFASAAGTALSLATKTAAYTVVGTDDVIIAGSGCSQIILAGSSISTGKIIRVKKTSAQPNDPVTIVASSATSSIDGSSYLLTAQYDAASFVYDGTNWNILDKQNTSIVQSCNVNPQGFGVVQSAYFQCMKLGGTYKVWGSFFQGTPTSSSATLSISFAGTSVINALPSGFVTKVGSFRQASTNVTYFGTGQIYARGENGGFLSMQADAVSIATLTGNAGTNLSGAPNTQCIFEATVPILNWM